MDEFYLKTRLLAGFFSEEAVDFFVETKPEHSPALYGQKLHFFCLVGLDCGVGRQRRGAVVGGDGGGPSVVKAAVWRVVAGALLVLWPDGANAIWPEWYCLFVVVLVVGAMLSLRR